MTVKRLYAAMKTFTILIRKFQCFHSIKRNCIKEFIGKKPVKKQTERQGIRTGKELRGCACVPACLTCSHVTLPCAHGHCERLSLTRRSLLGRIFHTRFHHVTFCHICHRMTFLRPRNPPPPYGLNKSSRVPPDHGRRIAPVCGWSARSAAPDLYPNTNNRHD